MEPRYILYIAGTVIAGVLLLITFSVKNWERQQEAEKRKDNGK